MLNLIRPAVYFVQMMACEEHGGPIKIGIAQDVERRIANLQSCSPYRLKLVLEIGGGESRESLLHRQFEDLRMRGEWFRAEQALIDFINESIPEGVAFRKHYPRTRDEYLAGIMGVNPDYWKRRKHKPEQEQVE